MTIIMFMNEALHYALHTDEAQQYFRNNATGTNTKNLSNSIGKMKIKNVSLPLQEEFDSYVQASEEQKKAATRRKEELLAARERLVDKYFR